MPSRSTDRLIVRVAFAIAGLALTCNSYPVAAAQMTLQALQEL